MSQTWRRNWIQYLCSRSKSVLTHCPLRGTTATKPACRDAGVIRAKLSAEHYSAMVERQHQCDLDSTIPFKTLDDSVRGVAMGMCITMGHSCNSRNTESFQTFLRSLHATVAQEDYINKDIMSSIDAQSTAQASNNLSQAESQGHGQSGSIRGRKRRIHHRSQRAISYMQTRLRDRQERCSSAEPYRLETTEFRLPHPLLADYSGYRPHLSPHLLLAANERFP